jgi:hypothetical protein
MPWKSTFGRTDLVAQRQVPHDLAVRQVEEEIPVSWKKDQMLMGYVQRYMLKGSGAGFVTPPYVAYWERVWGVTPIEDLPTYKDLYTFTPYVKASVDVTVNMAIAQGFELEGGKEEVREWLSDWLEEHNFLQTLRIIGTDMLVFGNAYIEVCREEGMPPEEWWLKPLDPVHMRVRRNEYGDVFGYIQLLTFPPVTFTAQDIVHYRYGAKSWWFEWSYGTSMLRPLLLIQSYIDSLQTDMATIVHVYTKPMLVVKAGTPQLPWSDTQLQQLVDAFSGRQAATDVFVRGDVAVDVIQSMTKDVNLQWWLDYLTIQRSAVLGVPKIFLGESERTNRATADIVMQEFVTRLRMLEELIGDTSETDLFKLLIRAKFGEGEEVPTAKWRPVWEPTLDVKAAYITNLVEKGIILRSEARPQLGYPEQPTDEALEAAKMLPALEQKSSVDTAIENTVKRALVEQQQPEEEEQPG